MPAGRCIKFITVYDQPFWRSEGLSGEVSLLDDYIQLILDTSPPDGNKGVLMSFAFSKEAAKMAKMPESERQTYVINTMVKNFGPKANKPIQLFQHDWHEDVWTRGCHVAHLAPGVMTSYGHEIREPFGCIHWATSESSPLWNGNIDGAVRAGEFVANELLSMTERSPM
jgi:monoamine oxidase